MPTGNYNLIDQPCIPARWKPDTPPGGSVAWPPDRVGFRELLLQSHDIETLAIADAPAHATLLRVPYAITAWVADLTEQAPAGDRDERRLDVLDEDGLQAVKVDAYCTQQFLDPSRTYEGPDPEEQMVDLWDPVTGSVPAGINHGTQP